MKNLIALFVIAASTAISHSPTTKAHFHHCRLIKSIGNWPHLFDESKIYRCDEGDVEISGQVTMTIENGYVYTEHLGEPGYPPPHCATKEDLTHYKWCPSPKSFAPDYRQMCGNAPIVCYDGKMSTWDNNWKGYSCATPDHKYAKLR